MALQVWLPLIRDLSNQGLANVTITNNGATFNSNGKLGGCYYFTPEQWIRISVPEHMTTIKNTTVAVWVKSHSTSAAVGGISHDGNSDLAGVTLTSGGWQISGSAGAWKYINSGTIANTQVWHHAACTIDDNEITTYLDGVKVITSTLTAQSIVNTDITSSNFIEIGCDHPGGNEFFTGYINDFRIYDHCLSAKEIKELSKGLFLHYKLDNTKEFDCSGYKYDGTITGTLSNSEDSARYSASTYFESYNDYIYCNLDNNIPDEITMNCWIKSSNKSPRGGFHNPVTIHSTNFEISILGSSGKTRIGYMVGGTRYVKDVGSDVLDNQWHMLTGTYDGQKICRYVDGELVDSQSVSGALTTLDTIRVGSVNATYGNTQLYQSDVRVYATALSASDILELYHTAANIDNHGNIYAGELKEV